MEAAWIAARRAEIKLYLEMASAAEMLCLMAASDDMTGFPSCGARPEKDKSRIVGLGRSGCRVQRQRETAKGRAVGNRGLNCFLGGLGGKGKEKGSEEGISRRRGRN